MSRAATKREYPLSMRLPAEDIDVIDRAADLRGRSRTDFVRDAAVRAAEEVLLERTVVRMTNAGYGAFAKAIAGRGRQVAALVAVLERKAPWE